MPIRLPQQAGELYRPSNGTEGGLFEAQFCERCKHDQFFDDQGNETGEPSCDILMRAYGHYTSDPEYPEEWVFDDDGVPMCTAFELEEEDDGRRPEFHPKGQLGFWEDADDRSRTEGTS